MSLSMSTSFRWSVFSSFMRVCARISLYWKRSFCSNWRIWLSSMAFFSSFSVSFNPFTALCLTYMSFICFRIAANYRSTSLNALYAFYVATPFYVATWVYLAMFYISALKSFTWLNSEYRALVFALVLYSSLAVYYLISLIILTSIKELYFIGS